MNNLPVIIVGGGASGMIAALSLKIHGEDNIIILERGERLGRKLMATGNGRCNISNANVTLDNYHGEDYAFPLYALDNFSTADSLNFFKKLGVLPRVEDNGKIYPYSNQASSVLDVLRFAIDLENIVVQCETEVTSIKKEGENFKVGTNNGVYMARKVIMAAGSLASPQLGGCEIGYNILQKMGHTLVPLKPALVQVKTENEFPKALKGIKFDGVASLLCNDEIVKKEEGEILFTDYGLSGPAIFNLSRLVGDYNLEKNRVTINLNFMPEFAETGLYHLLKERKEYLKNLELTQFLAGMLNKKIGLMTIKYANILPMSRQVSTLSDDELKALANAICNFELRVLGTTGWKNAQVATGGIDTNEINPTTMESKLVKGLYIVGEIMDVVGDCGGYNLQWAWSSGYLAGKAIGENND